VGTRSTQVSFGGTLQIYYQAFTSVRLASVLEQKGIHTVPILWLDDSRDCPANCILDVQNVPRLLTGIAGAAADLAQATPVGNFESAFSEFKNYLPITAFSDEVLDIIRSCRRDEKSLDEAKLLTQLLSRFGLIVAARDENLELLLAPLAKELKHKAGILETQRRKDGSESAACATSDVFPIDEQELSALLLPFALFPWVACVIGSEQSSTHGMLQGILEALQWKGPVILPSASFTLVEPKIGKVLEKFGLDLTDFLGNREKVRRQALSKLETLNMDNRFEKAEARVHGLFQSLSSTLKAADPRLAKALEEHSEKVLYQFRNLKGKQKQSWQRQWGIAEQQIEKTRNYLFPLGRPQEWTLNIHYFLVRYGFQFLDAVYDQVQAFNSGHRLFPFFPESVPKTAIAGTEFRIDKPRPDSV
jgi:uncharacterized protein YllA (UPF0747 family)